MCGENPTPELQDMVGLRITPACAGKTSGSNRRKSKSEDHPRVCGENDYAHKLSRPRGGSPPRVRGKPEELVGEIVGTGITPACAGKTNGYNEIGNFVEDHPRVCGENDLV